MQICFTILETDGIALIKYGVRRMGTLLGRTVLIVEDEPLIAIDLGQSFEDAGASVTIVGCLSDALAAVSAGGISAAVVDRVLPDGNSSSLLRLLTELGVPYIVVSGHSGSKCEGIGAAAYFSKPADPNRLVRAVEEMLCALSVSANASRAKPDRDARLPVIAA